MEVTKNMEITKNIKIEDFLVVDNIFDQNDFNSFYYNSTDSDKFIIKLRLSDSIDTVISFASCTNWKDIEKATKEDLINFINYDMKVKKKVLNLNRCLYSIIYFKA